MFCVPPVTQLHTWIDNVAEAHCYIADNRNKELIDQWEYHRFNKQDAVFLEPPQCSRSSLLLLPTLGVVSVDGAVPHVMGRTHYTGTKYFAVQNYFENAP